MVITYKLHKNSRDERKKDAVISLTQGYNQDINRLVLLMETCVIVLVVSCLLVLSRFSKEFLDLVNIGTV